MRVGVLNLGLDGEIHWDESEMFQSLKNVRFENWVRWIAKDVMMKEVKPPFQVKDAKVMREQGAIG